MSFHVTGPCSAHATVTVTGPSGPYSAVTNSRGGASVNVTASGVYSWSVSMNGYAPITGTIVLRCGVTPATTNVTFGALPYGYTCAHPDCCNEAGPPYAPVTYPGTLFFNDGLGTISLARDDFGVYTGSASRLASSAFHVPTCTWVQKVNVTIHIRVFCGWVDNHAFGQRAFPVFVYFHGEKDHDNMCGGGDAVRCRNGLCTSEDITCSELSVGFICPDESSTCSPYVVNTGGSVILSYGTGTGADNNVDASRFGLIYGFHPYSTPCNGNPCGTVTVGGTLTS